MPWFSRRAWASTQLKSGRTSVPALSALDWNWMPQPMAPAGPMRRGPPYFTRPDSRDDNEGRSHHAPRGAPGAGGDSNAASRKRALTIKHLRAKHHGFDHDHGNCRSVRLMCGRRCFHRHYLDSTRTTPDREQTEARLRDRESLYGEFITEASRLAVDAAAHSLEGPDKLINLYGILGEFDSWPVKRSSRKPRLVAAGLSNFTQCRT